MFGMRLVVHIGFVRLVDQAQIYQSGLGVLALGHHLLKARWYLRLLLVNAATQFSAVALAQTLSHILYLGAWSRVSAQQF
jgi:hypothetical protein